MKLVGFEPSIEVILTLTGRELLHLYYGSSMHYDGECKAATAKAGDSPNSKNGLLTKIIMFRLGVDSLGNTGYVDYQLAPTTGEFLGRHLDAKAVCCFSSNDLDLLLKICEQFGLIGGMKPPPEHFTMDEATRISMGLRRVMSEARLNLDILREQEKLRRESWAEAQKTALSVNAN